MTEASRTVAAESQSTEETSSAGSRQALIEFDWEGHDLDPLRRMISRTGVDLETALHVFFNGTPGRFNLIAQSDLNPLFRARCNLLDSIHRRIACGFYLPDTEDGLGRARPMLEDWIVEQENDRTKGRVGRWVFDHAMLDVSPATAVPLVPEPGPLHEALVVGFHRRFGRMIRSDRQIKPASELDE